MSFFEKWELFFVKKNTFFHFWCKCSEFQNHVKNNHCIFFRGTPGPQKFWRGRRSPPWLQQTRHIIINFIDEIIYYGLCSAYIDYYAIIALHKFQWLHYDYKYKNSCMILATKKMDIFIMQWFNISHTKFPLSNRPTYKSSHYPTVPHIKVPTIQPSHI